MLSVFEYVASVIWGCYLVLKELFKWTEFGTYMVPITENEELGCR